MWQALLPALLAGDPKALARSISLVENEVPGYEAFLAALPPHSGAKIIGLTGPPGAGKSTLADALVKELVRDNKRVGVLCVDPSSPFHFGAVLGDRIRLSDWYLHPSVFIRSLATRGSLGGLSSKIIEITSLLKAAPFDYILVETVGVGPKRSGDCRIGRCNGGGAGARRRRCGANDESRADGDCGCICSE
jgi:LAO/AO transport system kinase